MRTFPFFVILMSACVQPPTSTSSAPVEVSCATAPSIVEIAPRPSLNNPEGQITLLSIDFVGACEDTRVGYVDLEFFAWNQAVPANPGEGTIGGIDPWPVDGVVQGRRLINERGEVVMTQGPGLVTQSQYKGEVVLSRIIFTPYDAEEYGTPDARNWLLPARARRSIVYQGTVRSDAPPGRYSLQTREVRIYARDRDGTRSFTWPRGTVRGPAIVVTGGAASL